MKAQSLLLPGLHAHPSEPLLAAGSMTEIRWIDRQTGELVQRQEGHWLRSMGLAPDGSCLIAGGFGRFWRWQPMMGEGREDIRIQDFMIDGVAFTPDSRRVYLTSCGNQSLWTLESSASEAVHAAELGDWVNHLHVTLDGRFLITGGTSGVSALDPNDGHLLWRAEKAGFAFDMSRGDRTVLTMSRGDWLAIDTETGVEFRAPTPHGVEPCWSLSLSDDGSTAAYFDDDRVLVASVPESLPLSRTGPGDRFT